MLVLFIAPYLKLLSSNLFEFENDLSDYEGRYSEKVLNEFELFRKTYIGLITKRPKLKIQFYYASKGIEVHPNVKKQAGDLCEDVKRKLRDSEVDVTFVGADQLMRLSQERINNVYRLKLSENPMSSSGQVFIALVNLADFFNFIVDPEKNLLRHIFESNVRDYQGKTNVNNEIQETLENKGTEEFWWLNNGVTTQYSLAAGFKFIINLSVNRVPLVIVSPGNRRPSKSVYPLLYPLIDELL